MSKPLNLYVDASPISEERVSGIGHMTAELIRALETESKATNVQIILIVAWDKKEYIHQWNFQHVKVVSLPINQRVFNLLWKFDLLPPMDILLGKGVYLFPNYKNWRLAFSRSLTFVCDVSYMVVPEYVQPKNKEFLIKNIYKWIIRADKVLTISNSAKREIIEHLNVAPEKISIIPCGVDANIFRKKSNQEIMQARNLYGLPENYILFVGNIEPRKNISGLLEAYEKLPHYLQQKHPLVIVGGGGWLNDSILEEMKKAQQKGLKIIRPTKYVPDYDLPAIYSGASLLVHPAYYEGFGIPPLQAMACETPVVAADNTSLPEVVADAGLLVDAANAEDISAKIYTVLTEETLARELTKKGMNRVSYYSWKNSAQALSKVILEKD